MHSYDWKLRVKNTTLALMMLYWNLCLSSSFREKCSAFKCQKILRNFTVVSQEMLGDFKTLSNLLYTNSVFSLKCKIRSKSIDTEYCVLHFCAQEPESYTPQHISFVHAYIVGSWVH